MGITRIWNVTNDPSTDVKAQNLLVMGKLLLPGKYMQLDEARLKQAHALQKDIDRKYLLVSKNPPAYLEKASKSVLKKGLVSRSQLSAAASAVVEAPSEVKEEASTPEASKPQEPSAPTAGSEMQTETEEEAKARYEESSGKKSRKRW